MTGKVEMGSIETDDGKHIPYINVLASNGSLICNFTGNVTFDTVDAARSFVCTTHKILTSPVPNTIRYDRDGNADFATGDAPTEWEPHI